MIVQKFRQLLAQAFVAFAFVAEHHRPFEQRVLQIMREFAPEIGRRRSEDKKITRGVFVSGSLFRWRGHEQSSGGFAKLAGRPSPGNPATPVLRKQIPPELV
jgi:hypothetical protein